MTDRLAELQTDLLATYGPDWRFADGVKWLVAQLTEARAERDGMLAELDPPQKDGVWAGSPIEAIKATNAERDELAAQLAALIIRAGKLNDYKLPEAFKFPERARQIMAIVEAAKEQEFEIVDRGHAPSCIKYRDYGELYRAVRAYKGQSK